MMLLKNIHDVESFLKAVDRCRGQVLLRSADGLEQIDLKSKLSQYVAVERLHRNCGDEYEIYCMNKADENYLLAWFYDMRHLEAK